MRHKHLSTAVTAVTAVIAGLVLAGCGGGDDSSRDAGESSASLSDKQFNSADVEFAQQMIPHHRGAIEMAQMAQERSDSTEVRDLAAQIEQAQGPEIQTLTAWLQAWNADVPDEMSGMGDGAMGEEMPGMMSEDALDRLEGASGAGFDEMFLQMMVEHHQGAVEMARVEQADGENEDAVSLAEQIAADQKAEIEMMQEMLGS